MLGSPVSGYQPDFYAALCWFDPAMCVGWEPAIWPPSIFLSPHAPHACWPGSPRVRGACSLCQALDRNPHKDHDSWVCLEKFLENFKFSKWTWNKVSLILKWNIWKSISVCKLRLLIFQIQIRYSSWRAKWQLLVIETSFWKPINRNHINKRCNNLLSA